MSDERALIDLAAGGAPEAFDALVARHRPDVLRTARLLLGDAAAAEDVAQEVFLRMHASLPGFRGDAELSSWLYRVTLNLGRDQLRRLRLRRHDVDLAGAEGAEALRVDATAERAVDVGRAREAVRAALGRLPADQREALTLRYVEGLSYAEIARITGAPLGTIASRVFRALERLGRDLEPRHLEVVK